MGRCCVPNCRGNYDNGPKVPMFSFPKDDRREKWERAVRRDDIDIRSLRDPKSIALHEEEESRNKLTSYEDLVSRLQGLGLSTYWTTVKTENAVLFVHIIGEDPPDVERSVIVNRKMEITAFWRKVKVPAKDLLIPPTLIERSALPSHHT
ncbi:hypothetical protein HPB49_014497 [Dermacentor silvarum]|uniref:Uncharacterized protein n=1 Tax=Dermacentor silvarum TaxID=543639 RepID=A0ACB8DE94_DERSI|nr:hypothetical protein HPB49_014497 [Dermacentor silvarum]